MGVRFYGPDRASASGRYRHCMPAEWLYSHGWLKGNSVVVCMKHDWPEDPLIGAKSYIFDICDPHLDNPHYQKHIAEADVVTCNSEAMAELIPRDTVVIPDPIEYPPQDAHYAQSLLWYGHKSNLKSLWNVLPSLPNLPLDVISNDPRTTQWTWEGMPAAFHQAGCVIIPDPKPTASANRLIEAVNNGCFVVANPVRSYEEFPDMYLGDIGEGVRWYLEHPEEALERVRRCQTYIQKFSMDQIGPRWEAVIRGAH